MIARLRIFLGFGLAAFGPIAGLQAQNPSLKLERSSGVASDPWNGRTTLVFRVTVFHPAQHKGGSGEDFVVDPPGGWRGAVRLVVTDAAGKSVDWPFENAGQTLDQPLKLYRLGTASVSFLLRPLPSTPVLPPGRYDVRARLETTAGKWRGKVDSPPLALTLVAREQPRLELIGVEERSLRGWPVGLGVRITAPGGYDGGLTLATEGADALKTVELALTDAAGDVVALPIQRIPETNAASANVAPKESRTVFFRVSGEATRSLGDGPYRWVARFSVPPASRNPDFQWSGQVSTTSAPFTFSVPPVPLPAELARRQARAQIADALSEARLSPANAAAPLTLAERLAREWLDAHPDDAEVSALAASVMLAQGNRDRAVLHLAQSIESTQKRFGSDAEAAAISTIPARMTLRELMASSNPRGAAPSPVVRAVDSDAPSVKREAALKPATTGGPAAAVSSAAAPVPAGEPARPAKMGPPSPVTPVLAGVGTLVPPAELPEGKILADPSGQWAATATSKSSYGLHYRAVKATGAPDVSAPGFTIYAWSPALKDEGSDWLEVGFEKPVQASGVRIRQSHAPGAIAQIEAITPEGAVHVWWSGTDPLVTSSPREIAWLSVQVPQTVYLVAKIKITLDLTRRPDWKQIDAVQLVAAP